MPARRCRRPQSSEPSWHGKPRPSLTRWRAGVRSSSPCWPRRRWWQGEWRAGALPSPRSRHSETGSQWCPTVSTVASQPYGRTGARPSLAAVLAATTTAMPEAMSGATAAAWQPRSWPAVRVTDRVTGHATDGSWQGHGPMPGGAGSRRARAAPPEPMMLPTHAGAEKSGSSSLRFAPSTRVLASVTSFPYPVDNFGRCPGHPAPQ